MPAHIGTLNIMKIPLACVVQLFTKKGVGEIGQMGLATPAYLYDRTKAIAEKRNCTVDNYRDYRLQMDAYDPDHKRRKEKWTDKTEKGKLDIKTLQKLLPPVDRTEWDLFLKPDTVFDKAVEAILGQGWTVTFVGGRKQPHQELKRLEAKRQKGASSVTLWSKDGGGNEQLFG